ncbi:hypothetical protein KZX70_03835 [Paenibacillus silvae]|uniref:hypothetical protein n=1 Tax=Paenibacillus silvae TaxID=1325358 RepID=UPI002003B9C4|nr:hypothetical protein [Paenibacillus silvae]MCK6073971.1 hypothetical protein [Paenibacillus silvae]MCK6148551.1 hypothetical protein [Paenibacillus silvae]MCK6266852.1 hypothetical protein [Paenibacillus silvae]
MNWAAVPPANSAAALSVLPAEYSAYPIFRNKMPLRLHNKKPEPFNTKKPEQPGEQFN